MCVLLIILNAKIRLFVVCQSIYPPSNTLKRKKTVIIVTFYLILTKLEE